MSLLLRVVGECPPSPNDALSSAESTFPWVETEGIRTPPNPPQGGKEEGIRTSTQGGKEEEVVPAQGWVVNASGDVTLVGYNPSNAADSRNPRQNSVCPPR